MTKTTKAATTGAATRARAKKAAALAAAGQDKAVKIEATPGKTREEMLGMLATEGVLSNAALVASFSNGLFSAPPDLISTTHALRDMAKGICDGDMKAAELLLVAQAVTLNTVFTEMVRRSGLNMGEHLGAMESYMRLALKAQSQCRTTLEALAEIKNPRTPTFVRQTNVAHGPQQVNNGASPDASHVRTEDAATSPNGLLPAPAPGAGAVVDMAGAAGRGELQAAPR